MRDILKSEPSLSLCKATAVRLLCIRVVSGRLALAPRERSAKQFLCGTLDFMVLRRSGQCIRRKKSPAVSASGQWIYLMHLPGACLNRACHLCHLYRGCISRSATDGCCNTSCSAVRVKTGIHWRLSRLPRSFHAGHFSWLGRPYQLLVMRSQSVRQPRLREIPWRVFA